MTVSRRHGRPTRPHGQDKGPSDHSPRCPAGQSPRLRKESRKEQLSKAWALGRGPLAAVLPLTCCVRSRVSPLTPPLPLRWPQSPPTAPIKQRCGTWSLQQLALQGSVSCFKKSRKASWRRRRVLGTDGKAKPAEAEGRAPLGWGQVRAEGRLEGGGEEATSLSGADVRLGRKQSCQGFAWVPAAEPGPGTSAQLGRCCPLACPCLQSEAEALQLGGAGVSELLTALAPGV